MDNVIIYGPCALFVITTLINMGVFAKSGELKQQKAELLQYTNENFVSKETYFANHTAIETQLAQVRADISEIKTLLITTLQNILNRKDG